MRQDTAPDWPEMIAALLTRGLPQMTILRAMGYESNRVLDHLMRGVQPLYHRGARLVTLYCQTIGTTEDKIPMQPVIRGHRAAKRKPAPVVNLPQWPPVKPQRPILRAKRKDTAEA